MTTGMMCTKVLLHRRRAIGVELIRGQGMLLPDTVCSGSREKVFAEAGVILAAGAINSPQLLMLSGIGPASHLKVCTFLFSQGGNNDLKQKHYIFLYLHFFLIFANINYNLFFPSFNKLEKQLSKYFFIGPRARLPFEGLHFFLFTQVDR
jgi:hypothetical protein